MPGDLHSCFKGEVQAPKAGVLSKADTYELVGKLRHAEVKKNGCGRRIIKLYDRFT